jgi:hypothetical protein
MRLIANEELMLVAGGVSAIKSPLKTGAGAVIGKPIGQPSEPDQYPGDLTGPVILGGGGIPSGIDDHPEED